MPNPPIYLASPYTHKSKFIQELRYRAARENVARILNDGIEQCVYSPIVHCHWMAEMHNMPGHFEFWQEYDRMMIETLPRFGILQLPCWRASKGIQGEMDIAHSLGKTIEFYTPQGELFDALNKLT